MRKIKLLLFSTVFALLLGGINLYSNEPFAPVFSVPDGIEDKAEWKERQEEIKRKLPSKSEVGIPAYPGAVVYEVYTAQELSESSYSPVSDAPELAKITILATDPVNKVAEFYSNNLPENWEFDPTMNSFWDGDYEYSMQLIQGPDISIEDGQFMVGTPQEKVVPDLGCSITIIYIPN